MNIIHGYNDYIPWYNNGYDNPMYNAHKNVGAHYTRQNTVTFSNVKTVVSCCYS